VKYWGYFCAKLAAALLLLWGAYALLKVLVAPPEVFLRHEVRPFGQDLKWTTILLLLWLAGAGLFYLAAWDQRRRCRTCLRRLRMPINRGDFGHAMLFGPPRLESICPFGHGTLNEPEAHISVAEEEWREHTDMWKELEESSSGKR
jgi:hypothetical protein